MNLHISYENHDGVVSVELSDDTGNVLFSKEADANEMSIELYMHATEEASRILPLILGNTIGNAEMKVAPSRYELALHNDTDIEDPIDNEWSPITIMTNSRRNGLRIVGKLAQELEPFRSEFMELGLDEAMALVKEEFPDAIIERLWVFEHGNKKFRSGKTNPFTCKWDSGLAGFIMTTRKEWGDTGTDEEVVDGFNSYLEEYNAYLNGDGFAYSITDKTDPDDDYNITGGYYTEEAALEGGLHEVRMILRSDPRATAYRFTWEGEEEIEREEQQEA